jgi:DUF1680 family protein
MKILIPTLLLATCLSVAGADPHPGDYPIQPVPFSAVKVRDAFWSPRLETNRTVTIWSNFKKCEDTGRFENFDKAAGKVKGDYNGTRYDDSDVYKCIEGAAYSLALAPDPKLDQFLDDLITRIAAAQEPDGYLYTIRVIPPDRMPEKLGKKRWERVYSSQELYNCGHLYEAAVAHFQATGKRTLLGVALKNADLLCQVFGPGEGQLREPPDHQGVEMGLCKLYRITGQQRYLDLARFYVEARGQSLGRTLRGANRQDHKPIYEQEEAVSHAVKAAYYYSGAADVAALTGDPKLLSTVDRLWEDVVSRKLYLTGGLGAKREGEAFGSAFELPNLTAYNETCAAIANVFWNHRMFLLHGHARYLDVLERTLYNGMLSGVALNGREFFYPNPLASKAGYQRSPWFHTACCPVNVVRFLPAIGGYVYAARDHEVFVNLFIGGTARLTVGHTTTGLRQQTRYPYDGKVSLTVTPEKPLEFTLNVRIPGWAQNQPVPGDLYRYNDGLDTEVKLSINSQPAALVLKNGFAQIHRTWQPGDQVELNLPMHTRCVAANSAVKENAGRFAVERGPLVYCAEGVDNGGKVLARVPGKNVRFETRERPDLFGGIVTVQILPKTKGDPLTLIPYCLWENRGTNEMSVWFPAESPSASWAASHFKGEIEACFDGVLPGSSDDHSIPRMTWWDHKGTSEWVERQFDQPKKLSSVEVYWFDDTGRGGCRVPKSWRLLHRDGPEWKPVAALTDFGVQRNQFNRATFTPVTTSGLRLEVQLQPGYSAGILEWRTSEP